MSNKWYGYRGGGWIVIEGDLQRSTITCKVEKKAGEQNT